MSSNAIIQIGLFFAVLLLLTKPVGAFMAKIFDGKLPLITKPVRSLERVPYRLFGICEAEEMNRLQGALGLNLQKFGAISPDDSFRNAVSFVANTNRQSYAPEQTKSHRMQMLVFTVRSLGDARRLRRRPRWVC